MVTSSFLGLDRIAGVYTVVDDDTGSGRIHRIDIEVGTLVLAIVDFDPVDDEQRAKAMNLVELVILLLLGGHDKGVWKKCLLLVIPS
jgi:hypothetical protein